jgi:hypothetical protein
MAFFAHVTESRNILFSLFTFQNKYVMIKAVKTKKRNSTCSIRFQRAAGRCEAVDEKQGTHLGVAA